MSELKTIIDANIKENGNQEITGKTLNYVLNKIAEGTQKDWNESDATDVEYIKGRTHGVTYEHVSVEGTLKELGYVPGEYVSVLHYARDNGVLEGKGLYLGGLLYNPIVGEEYRVKYEGPSVYAKVVEVDDGYDVQIKGASDTGKILKVAIVGYKTIDDAYISTDIARKSQVDALEQKVDNLPKGEEFDKQGNYPLLHVGTADDLAGRGESVPASFGFRASGGKSIKDGRAYIKRIKGNSVVWNQKYPTGWSITKDGITSTSVNGKISAIGTIIAENYFRFEPFSANIANHKYLFTLSGASSALEGKRFGLLNRGGASYSQVTQGFACLFYLNDNASSQRNIGIRDLSEGTSLNENVVINQYDLTQMFQAGNEPTTIEEFNARVATLGVDLNAYNEGQVIHCNTESIKSVGDNAWDEEWELGSGNSSTGDISNGISVVSKNYIPIVGGEKYYISSPTHAYLYFYDSEKKHIAIGSFVKQNTEFSVPTNARYMRFQIDGTYGSIYNHDVMISLVHSGWKQDTDAGYQPYWEDTLPLPIIRKYFPDGMKKAGTAHDEIRYNKATQKWEYSKGKIKSVDLGDYNWVIREYNGYSCFSARQISIGATWDGQTHNFICAKYSCVGGAEIYAGNDKSLSLNNGYFGNQDYKDHIVIRDTSYTDAASFKAAMAGVILYYESNDWEWEELDAEDQNFRDYYNVADFGTEQSQSSVPSAAFSADIIYQFNAVDMIREHELEIAELQKVIATMQAQLASLTNS